MRYTGPSCRQCRREGTKLFLKGTKCFTEKCPVERRPYAARPARPEHRPPPQDVGVLQAAAREAEDQAHLRREREAVPQHLRARRAAARASPDTTFSPRSRAVSTTSCTAWVSRASRKAARQLIRHRHVEINGKRVDMPSFLVQPGQEIRVRMKSREQACDHGRRWISPSRGAPLSWIAVDKRHVQRPDARASDAAEHPDRCAGTAGRRVVLEVAAGGSAGRARSSCRLVAVVRALAPVRSYRASGARLRRRRAHRALAVTRSRKSTNNG